MRQKDEHKKQALQQAVLDVIVTEGYQNLSIAKIAVRAKVSVATLYIYFQDKQDMLDQVYLHVKDLIDADLFAHHDATQSVAAQFRLLLDNYAHALNHYPKEAAAMRVFNNNPGLLSPAVYQRGMDRGAPIAAVYRRGVAEHRFRTIAPDLLIGFTFEPFDSLGAARFAQGQQISDDEIQTMIDMAWAACTAPTPN